MDAYVRAMDLWKRYGEAVGYMAGRIILRGVKVCIRSRGKENIQEQSNEESVIDMVLDLANILHQMCPYMTEYDKNVVHEIFTRGNTENVLAR
jgi:hypothetical protein